MASLCDALTSISKDCLNSIGGVDEVLLNDLADIASVTITSGEVTAIALDGGSPVYFQAYQMTRDSSVLSHTAEVDTTAGSTLYAQTLTLQFKRQELAKRNSVMLMAAGQRDLVALVKDNNGQWWLAGYSPDLTQGLQLTGGESSTGTAKSDMNGYVVELSNQLPERPYPVDSSIIAALLAP